MVQTPTRACHRGLFDGPEVFLTIKAGVCGFPSIYFKKKAAQSDRILVINWNNFFDYEKGDLVGLFDYNVEEAWKENFMLEEVIRSAIDLVKVKKSRGRYETKARMDQRPTSTNQDCDLGYWVVYIGHRNGAFGIVESNSLQIYPRWMQEHKGVIGCLPVYNMMIPGTHDSGAWKRYDSVQNIYDRYYICQEDSIYEQLLHGIRYLDIRVAHYPNTKEKFWINHDVYRFRPLETLLKELRDFVEETDEIVILDFHRFPVGFNENHSVHAELVDFVFQQLLHLLVPTRVGEHVTMNQIWKLNKNIIFCYSNDYYRLSSTQNHKDYLWPYLHHSWGDKRKKRDLHAYLNNSMKENGNKCTFWSAMAEITPRRFDYISKPFYGLRGFADSINCSVTYWFERKAWYTRAMIVSTDFYLGNNLIQICIEVNVQRGLSFQNDADKRRK